MIALDGNQIRQLIDTQQAFRAYREALHDREIRFQGSMRWKHVSGRDYLYMKKRGQEKSLGPRSEETELQYSQFRSGRATARKRLVSFDRRLREMAPLNRYSGLGRIPLMTARILRRLDRLGMLGHGLRVAGTHALYAYEALAAVHFAADNLATQDIDLLLDARAGVKLVGSAGAGLIGELESIDASFRLTEQGSFRAVNDRAFMVDLITPLPRNPGRAASPRGLGAENDIRAVEIAGLHWLENSPPIDQIAIDERGFPLRIVAPDPRAFAIHKFWVAGRPDRDPAKRYRDAAQARAVTAMVVRQLTHLRFDDPVLNFLPADLRSIGTKLAAEAQEQRLGFAAGEDGWI